MYVYNTFEIAHMFDVSPQYVRSWCKTGKLKATMHSTTEGYRIKADDLFDFYYNYYLKIKRHRRRRT